jgi:putative membrane protein
MINNFNDLSANERTYLAWVRTSLALMAFGFLIERFDLFFRMINKNFNNKYTHSTMSITAEFIGIAIMITAVLVIISSTIRYTNNRKKIKDNKLCPYNSKKHDIILSCVLVTATVLLIGYIVVSIIS